MCGELKNRKNSDFIMAILENSIGTLDYLESQDGEAAIEYIREYWLEVMGDEWLPIDCWVIKGTDVSVCMGRGRCIFASCPKKLKDVLDIGEGTMIPFKPYIGGKVVPLIDHLDVDMTPLNLKKIKGKKTKKYIQAWRRKFQTAVRNDRMKTFITKPRDCERSPTGTYTMSTYPDMFPPPPSHPTYPNQVEYRASP
jgi:hypothetical protein